MGLERWKDLIGEEELKAYEKAGFGNRIGFGKHPALLNVDMTYMFVDPDYTQTYGDMTPVLEAVVKLTQAARTAKIPIFYSRRDDRNHPFRRGIWNLKLGTSGTKEYTVDEKADQWPPGIDPRPEDVIVYKNKPSPFFGTPLASMLSYAGVDTLIIVGISTSGCVRAAVEDAFSYNYRVIVPEECTGDRCQFARRANLFDMDMKFADVVSLEDVLVHIRSLKI
ncbi:MAG: isochorismatase family protein [Deltaproteobacteria bacterium]|nr:isochorismatase family protein [Deltaproteobacteria bacterium]